MNGHNILPVNIRVLEVQHGDLRWHNDVIAQDKPRSECDIDPVAESFDGLMMDGDGAV